MKAKTLDVYIAVDEKALSEKYSLTIRAKIRAFKICLACLPGTALLKWIFL